MQQENDDLLCRYSLMILVSLLGCSTSDPCWTWVEGIYILFGQICCDCCWTYFHLLMFNLFFDQRFGPWSCPTSLYWWSPACRSLVNVGSQGDAPRKGCECGAWLKMWPEMMVGTTQNIIYNIYIYTKHYRNRWICVHMYREMCTWWILMVCSVDSIWAEQVFPRWASRQSGHEICPKSLARLLPGQVLHSLLVGNELYHK